MKSLYERIETGNGHTPDIAGEMLAWLDDRLLRDDAVDALRGLLPGLSDVDILQVVATICQVVRQP